MRKNTKRMLEAFVDGGKARGPRDKVEDYTWWLHGSKIAVWEADELVLRSCGFHTNTTKDRLNAILRHHGCDEIRQKDFVWYIGDESWGGVYTISFDHKPKGHPTHVSLF